jgi:hypothetical protein
MSASMLDSEACVIGKIHRSVTGSMFLNVLLHSHSLAINWSVFHIWALLMHQPKLHQPAIVQDCISAIILPDKPI